jgi:hypothetical protein
MVVFGRDGVHLLVASSQGRGVFDCRTGERVARDATDGGWWNASQPLTCPGIGPLAGEAVTCAGLDGGGLLTGSADWKAELLYRNLVDEVVILSPINSIWQMPDR